MSLARQKGNQISSRYATRIERPDGHLSYVFKKTILVERPNPVHYLTFLEPAEEADFQPIPDLRELNLTQTEFDAAKAVLTVRKLRELMASFGIDTLRAGALTPSEMQSILTVFQSTQFPKRQPGCAHNNCIGPTRSTGGYFAGPDLPAPRRKVPASMCKMPADLEQRGPGAEKLSAYAQRSTRLQMRCPHLATIHILWLKSLISGRFTSGLYNVSVEILAATRSHSQKGNSHVSSPPGNG